MRRHGKESSQLLQDLGGGHVWSLDGLGDYWLVGVSLSPHDCEPQRRYPTFLHYRVITRGSHNELRYDGYLDGDMSLWMLFLMAYA